MSTSTPASSTVRFQVSGMHCAGCVASVERALQRVPGVLAAGVNLATRQGFATGNDPLLSLQSLQPSVTAAGYRLEPLPAAEQAGQRDDQQQREMAWRWSLWAASLAAALPVVIISMGEISFPGRNILLALLSAPVVFGTGWSIWTSAISGLRHGRTDMQTLIALGTGAAFAASLWATCAPGSWPAGQHPHVFYEAAVMIMVFVTLGRLLEERARGKASDAVRRLLAWQSPTARVRRPEGDREIPIADVRIGDEVVIKPGERLPVDGIILEGTSWIDESMLTGEPVPMARQPADRCYAGTLNQTGGFILRATQVGDETVLRQIVRLMQDAQGSKAPIARLADVVSSYFVPVILVIAAVTFVSWLTFGPPETSLTYAVLASVSVLIIACPCALGLATPTAIMVAIGRGAELGVLIKSATALELAEQSQVVIFDKTGTLTVGRPVVTAIHTVDPVQVSESDLLRLAAAVEARSEHPLAAAVLAAARERTLAVPTATNFSTVPGEGVAATVEGQTVSVGNPRWMRSLGCVPAEPQDALPIAGQSLLLVAIGKRVAGWIDVADRLKASAAPAVQALRQQGRRVILLTGDRRATAEAVALEIGITEVVAEVLPADKIRHVRQLQQAGLKVIMVGDGINDAPALAQADVGIAVGSGTDVALESSGIVLPASDLTGIATAVELSERTMRTIRQNLGFAFFYNLLGVPLAAGLFYPVWHHLLDPMVASAAMALSSVSVVANSLRLKRFQPSLTRIPDVVRSHQIETKRATSLAPSELMSIDLGPFADS